MGRGSASITYSLVASSISTRALVQNSGYVGLVAGVGVATRGTVSDCGLLSLSREMQLKFKLTIKLLEAQTMSCDATKRLRGPIVADGGIPQELDLMRLATMRQGHLTRQLRHHLVDLFERSELVQSLGGILRDPKID